MDKNLTVWQIPVGVRDVLPEEALQRRNLEERLANLFSVWGYREMIPPSLEYYEQLKGSSPEEQLFKLIDPSGRILALRPDLTTPIARMVATHLQDELLPNRLYYFGNAFRYEAIQAGRQREFQQAGVELIGAAGTGADAEVIVLAVEALKLAGLTDFQLGIGQVALTHGLLEDAEVPQELIKKIKKIVVKKDFVGLEEKLTRLGLPESRRKEITTILALRGGKEVLVEAKRLARAPGILKAISNLEEVYQSLEALGLTKYVFFDFSILRDFDYYTGIVFEGYAAGLGHPVCGGGRYDHLLGQFGWQVPATGFAIGIERLMQTLPREKESPMAAFIIGGSLPERFAEAARQRQNGCKVEVDIFGLSLEEGQAYITQRDIANLIDLGEVKGDV